eukprot:61388-Rhodomonas_salina.2
MESQDHIVLCQDVQVRKAFQKFHRCPLWLTDQKVPSFGRTSHPVLRVYGLPYSPAEAAYLESNCTVT